MKDQAEIFNKAWFKPLPECLAGQEHSWLLIPTSGFDANVISSFWECGICNQGKIESVRI